jgi:sn-glycerol 3-phosphate transport system ATP-binding protein
MGRAIVRKPKAFLFDEPLSNLDAKLRGQMRIEIKRLQRNLATTSVYVTHDQLEAMTLADRLVVMNAGRIEQVGTPMELYSRPATLFVAGFIGSPPMNLVDLAYLRDRGAQLAVPADTDLVGIRPDSIHVEDPGRPAIQLAATVELYEPIGGESHLHLRLAGSEQLIVAAVPARTSVAEGQRLELFVPADEVHPFNKATGQRTD